MVTQSNAAIHADLSYLSSNVSKPTYTTDLSYLNITLAKLDQINTDGSCASSSLPKLECQENLDELRTPFDFEAGVLREGEAPDYGSPEILALLFQYAVNGIVYGGINGLKYPVLTSYFNLQSNVLNSATALLSLGLSLKVFFGLLTDCFPIYGYHRKPYILLGWLATAILLVIMAIKPAGAPAPDPDASINGAILSITCAAASFCYILAEVAQDALMVSYAQREPVEHRGRLQSLVYTVRMTFIALVTAVSGLCLNSSRMAGNFSWDIGINGYLWVLAIPAVVNVPVVWFFLKDAKQVTYVYVSAYFDQVWQLCQRRVVWQVMIFQFVFTLFTTTIWTTAAPYVSLYWAKVENLNSALMTILGDFINAAVIYATGRYGTNWNWRHVLIVATISINIIDSVVQYVTIYDIHRSQWLYLGGPLVEEVPWGLCFVVGVFVIVELAEEGTEGVMYGLITTITNLPGPFGSMITNVIDANLAVDTDSIQSDSKDARNGVALSYVIAYGFTFVGAFSVILLPPQKGAVAKLKRCGGSYPRLAAFIFYVFFVVLATSITGTLASMFDITNCFALAGGTGCPPETSQLYLLGIFVPAVVGLLVIGALKLYWKEISTAHYRISSMEQRTSERLSHVVPSPTKSHNYDDLKTPALDLEGGGVLRSGDAPVYSSPEILALLFQYAAVGVVYGGFNGLKYPILTGYFHLEGNVLNSASSLLSLGWCVKVFFGMLSDCFPIFGYRRKPYILIGWITTAALLVILAIKPAGQPAPDPDSDTNGTVLAMICAVASFTYIMAECAQDALMVSYAQREPIEYRGHLQSLVYTVKMTFVALITAISGFCLNSERMAGTYDWDIGVNGYMWTLAAPVAINIPIVWFFLKDTKQDTSVALYDYFDQFWQLAQRRAVWQVMIFQFIFTLFTSTIWTTAAPYVSLYWAQVDTINSALMTIIGNLVYAGVIYLTGKYGANWNWRYLLISTTAIIFVIDSITQYITIYNIYRNQWFYLGSALTEEVPWGICFVVG
ncbi:folate-Biopterin Transporter (FBT) family, partial [Thraustotheca clavata]